MHCITPAVILSSGWRVVSFDQGALHHLETTQTKREFLIDLYCPVLLGSVCGFAQPHRVMDTVGSYPPDALL